MPVLQSTSRFDGRAAFVTGAGSGIGRAVAIRFAAEGGRAAVVDRDAVAAAAVAAEIVDAGGEALALTADVSSVEAVEAAVAATVERWGTVDVLINNAGVSQDPQPTIDVTDEQFRAIIDVNLFGVFACTRAVARVMVARGYGRIVNVGSRTHLGEPRMAIYSASKAALTGFTRSIAMELGPHGITVNVVAPGSTITPLMQAHPDHEVRVDRLLPTVPVRRLGTPEDNAAAILFLASEEAGYVTSELIHVTGGRYHSSTPMGVDDARSLTIAQRT